MTNQEFELYLQKEISPEINFRQNSGNLDIKSIYYGDVYTETAIPSGDINEERMPNYCDNFGYPHRGSKEATERVKTFIERFNTDIEFKNDVLGIEITEEVPSGTVDVEYKTDESSLPK
ncbi:MAG: hypothetical protein ACR2IQ_02580 [Minisyncoccia bacterium]